MSNSTLPRVKEKKRHVDHSISIGGFGIQKSRV